MRMDTPMSKFALNGHVSKDSFETVTKSIYTARVILDAVNLDKFLKHYHTGWTSTEWLEEINKEMATKKIQTPPLDLAKLEQMFNLTPTTVPITDTADLEISDSLRINKDVVYDILTNYNKE